MRIHHQDITGAASVKTIDARSSHADYQEIASWLKENPTLPQRILLNHGQAEAQDKLAEYLSSRFKIEVSATYKQEEWAL